MTRPLRALIRNDLLVYFRDRRAVVISFALPAALSLFFGLAFGGASRRSERPHVPILVVDEDRSPAARRLVDALVADATLTAREVSLEAAREAVTKGKQSVAVVIPAGFAAQTAAALQGGTDRAALRFLYDPSSPFQLAMVKGVVHAHVIGALAPEIAPERLAACAGLAQPYRPEDEPMSAGEHYDGAAHAVAGMAVQFILMGSIELGVGILNDRQRGLWKRLRAAPLSRWTLLSGKILSGTIISLLVLAFLFLWGRLTMGVLILGSILGLVAIGVAFAFLASTLGVLVSTLGKTPQATRSLGIFVVLVGVMLGGAWFPTFLFPAWLQPITYAIPTRWAVDGLDAMTWRGLGVEAALVPTASLLGAALVFGLLAVWRFRWEE